MSNCGLLWSKTSFLLPLMGEPAQSNILHSNLFRSAYFRDHVASITVLKNYFNSGNVISFCFKKLGRPCSRKLKIFLKLVAHDLRKLWLWYSLLLKRWRIQISQIVCSNNTIPTVVFSGRFMAMEETDSCDQPKAKSKIPTQGHWTGHPLTFFSSLFIKGLHPEQDGLPLIDPGSILHSVVCQKALQHEDRSSWRKKQVFSFHPGS